MYNFLSKYVQTFKQIHQKKGGSRCCGWTCCVGGLAFFFRELLSCELLRVRAAAGRNVKE